MSLMVEVIVKQIFIVILCAVVADAIGRFKYQDMYVFKLAVFLKKIKSIYCFLGPLLTLALVASRMHGSESVLMASMGF